MRTDLAAPVRLSEYRPTDHLIETVELAFDLRPSATAVRCTMRIRPNPAGSAGAALVLDGEDLTFRGAEIEGAPLAEDAYSVTPDLFRLDAPPQRPFTLTIETEIDPSANTELSGLYRSSGCYCTQCEAEGFRRIIYFLDRPDVLAIYTTRIRATRDEAPLLLSNGNSVSRNDLGDGRHEAVWHDPWPKPSYLFALVAGDLAGVHDRFVTASGRTVELGIYVEHGKEDRCAYAMDALKRAMRWDETRFGREYDLEVFNIVAVSDFNMGAMENKGLNVFNDRYVLARPDTATDADYANIEAIIAHEYFHNWTGNRITCRDWFQLCLKEGLTVYRDQEFSSDQRSRAVKRIADIRLLRGQQFPEDAGPLAHPVRPSSYREINNFYTATVYEKGAEVIRMLATIIGEPAFRAGMDVYFDRHDGHAATVEQFLACFAESSGRDLDAFMRWYEQAGTPEVQAEGAWDGATYRLTLRQVLPPSPGQTVKHPQVIPIRFGLVGPDGDLPLDDAHRPGMVVLDDAETTLTFKNLVEEPVPSLLRGFSAPVRLTLAQPPSALLRLMARDSDPVNRWQAAQTYATALMIDAVRGRAASLEPFADALRATLDAAAIDPAFTALVLTLPTESDIAREIGRNIDPDVILRARRKVRAALADRLGDDLMSLRQRMASGAPYAPDASGAGRRSLHNVALDLACASGRSERLEECAEQARLADNMTDRLAALATLSLHRGTAREAALQGFRNQFRDDPLVIDKWLTIQAQIPEAGTLDRVRGLAADLGPALANPNRVRALVGAFATGNPSQFNRPDGKGYQYVAQVVLDLDRQNPQTAARLLGAFKSWQVLQEGRRAHARAALEAIRDRPNLSRDVMDIATRALI